MKDRISSLPSSIIALILMEMPIRDAVQSSILSSRWRYEWCTMPDLIFRKDGFPSSLHSQLGRIVDHVLLLRIGPIRKFVLDGYTLQSSSFVNRWLVVLSRNGVKELTLIFCPSRVYRLPSSLFICQALTLLDLHHCKIRLPSVFFGFVRLTSLVLDNVTISDDHFATLISKSPILRKLVFINFFECETPKINAPNLEELVVDGFFLDIHLEHTPLLLTSFKVGLEDGENEVNYEPEDGQQCGFIKALDLVLNVEWLDLRTNMMEFLARQRLFDKLPTYNYLKRVYITCFNFKDMKQNTFLLCLFQSSPMLRELEIEADTEESIAVVPTKGFYAGKECLNNTRLCGLRNVKLVEVLGAEPELEFIEFVLANAPGLERMDLGLACNVNEADVFKQIMRFRRASTLAEVVYLE